MSDNNPIQKLHPKTAYTFTEDRLEALKAVVPEAFADGKIDWDALQEALGEHIESDEIEYFGLSWAGKRQARRIATTPSKGTLIPDDEASINPDTSRNIFIEADNLEALKLLQKSYAGRVKMIYIDPPYNTGNDFVYNDSFSESEEDYLERAGALSDTGKRLTTNTKTSGRFHANWLNMMYPRLRLARTLLRDDGVIFVSIDDNESHHLRILMDEIFGAENFIANISWEKRYTRSNNAKMFYSLKDTILIYRKSSLLEYIRDIRTDKSNSIYTNPDKDPRGSWTSSSYVNPATKEQRKNLVYTIHNPFTKQPINHPTHAWKYEPAEYERHVRENRLWWGKNGTAKFPRLKVFLSEGDDGLVPVDLWNYQDSGTTDEGGQEMKLFFGEAIFDNPKPTKLIKRMLNLITTFDENDIILDFFAGSGTTAQAVMELNAQDGGNRQFILVQLNEPTSEKSVARQAGYDTISQITMDRIKKVIEKINTERAGQLPLDGDNQPDLGFRVFRYVHSHYAPWEDYAGDDIEELTPKFSVFQTPLVDNWNPDNLLYEVMLLNGFPLDSHITRLDEYSQNTIVKVTSDFHAHALYVCLDSRVHEATLEEFALDREDLFVCLDSALTDESKFRLRDHCQLRVI